MNWICISIGLLVAVKLEYNPFIERL